MVERYDANLSRFSGSRRAEPTITEQCGKVLGHLMGLPGPVEQSKLLEENKRTATEQEVVRGMVTRALGWTARQETPEPPEAA